MKFSLNVPPHLERVATLRCEICGTIWTHDVQSPIFLHYPVHCTAFTTRT